MREISTQQPQTARLSTSVNHFIIGTLLDGGSKLLDRSYSILFKLSMLPLYRGQRLWFDCLDHFDAAGWSLWALNPFVADFDNGRTLQSVGFFIRE